MHVSAEGGGPRTRRARHAGAEKKGQRGASGTERDDDPAGSPTIAPAVTGEPQNGREEKPMGMLRNLLASGVAAKVIRELQKPQNQAKIKQAVRDFQNKNKKGGPRGRAY
jgi:hypothetical protein